MPKTTTRPVEEIRADIAASRARMAASLGDFVEEVHPKNVAKRTVSQAKGFVTDEFEAAKAHLKDDGGGWRTDRLLAIGGAVLGVVVFAITINSIAKRRTLAVRARALKALEG